MRPLRGRGGIPPVRGARCAPHFFFSLLEKKKCAAPGGKKKRGWVRGRLDRASLLVWVLVEVCISLVQGRHLRYSIDRAPRRCGAEVGHGQRYKPLLLKDLTNSPHPSHRTASAPKARSAYANTIDAENFQQAPSKAKPEVCSPPFCTGQRLKEKHNLSHLYKPEAEREAGTCIFVQTKISKRSSSFRYPPSPGGKSKKGACPLFGRWGEGFQRERRIETPSHKSVAFVGDLI